MPEVQTLTLKAIELDVELQPREDIDRDLVAEYAEAIMAGAQFPAVVVFRNGSAEHLLADGWHRYYAHQVLKRDQIEAEVHEGDRSAALCYSLGANATHGRQRSPLTIQRAYAKAIKHGLVDAADREKVRDLIRISDRYARELTQDAYQAHQQTQRSLALALSAQGLKQQKIADRLGVDKATVSRWLLQIGAGAETQQDAPARLLAKAELDAIAAEIAAAARAELEPLLRVELRAEFEQEIKDRIAAVEKQFETIIRQEREQAAAAREEREAVEKRAEENIATLKRQLIAAAEDAQKATDAAARDAAEATAKRLKTELKKAQDALSRDRKTLESERAELARAIEEAKEAPLGETEEEAEERQNQETRDASKRLAAQLSGPACDGWFKVLQAIDAVKAIDLAVIEAHPYPQFERQAIEGSTVAFARLRAAFGIATRSVQPEESDE